MNHYTLEVPAGENSAATLLKLTTWAEVFDFRLRSQSTWLEVLEDNLLVELRTYFREGEFSPSFINGLLDAVLRRRITGVTEVYDEVVDAPYRWEGQVTQEVPAERRGSITQIIESFDSGLVRYYIDYLRRHWQGAPTDLIDKAGYETALQCVLDTHGDACEAIFNQPLIGWSADNLRQAMAALQDDWRRQSSLRVLASVEELDLVDRLVEARQPVWLKSLEAADRALLQQSQVNVDDALSLEHALLSDVQTLAAYAAQRAKTYLGRQNGNEMEPDLIKVHRQFNAPFSDQSDSLSLTELVTAGVVNAEELYTITRIDGPRRHYRMPSPQTIGALLMEVDARSDYLQALADRYAQEDVRKAMTDAWHEQLKHSALIGRAAGHLSSASTDLLRASWVEQGAELEVCDIQPVEGLTSSDLLLFYRQDSAGELNVLLLYAPGKPDGQEWIEVSSLRALSAELGGWLKDEAGRQYLLQQLPHADRTQAAGHFANVLEQPMQWGLGRDCRGNERGYAACLAAVVAKRQANRLAEVERSSSPRWHAALGIEERRIQNANRQWVEWRERDFHKQMLSYATFMDYAKRKVSDDIRPYLASRGISETVDPETVLMDYSQPLDDRNTRTVNLLEMAIYGYNDNTGIDHPQRGVRSSVEQDLSQVYSADLARYARRAHLGDKYKEKVRGDFLNESAPEYGLRRNGFVAMQVAMIDRDLRFSLQREHLPLDIYEGLTALVSQAVARPDTTRDRLNPTSVASSSGMFRFTVADRAMSGVYVFRLIRNGQVQDWLYTPDSPDDRLLRLQGDLQGAVAEVLRDYLVGRAALVDQDEVASTLLALASGQTHLDSIREGRRVISLADEFDAGVEHALADVESICLGRARMIQAQVLKGVMFAALPLALICPPFALLMDIALFTYGLRRAVVAHSRGDTAEALQGWLEASWSLLGIHLGAHTLRGLQFLRSSPTRVVRVAERAADEISSVRLDKRWAVEQRPTGLQAVTEDGVWRGTYRSADDGTHYVFSSGRFYRVTREGADEFLRVVNARRPDSYYKLPVRVARDGRLRQAQPGLRGGEVRDLGRVDDLREAFPGHVAPDPSRGAFQGEAVVAAFNGAQADNYLFTLNVQTCVAVSLYNPATRAGAVLHFDHNINAVIDRAVRAVLPRVQGASRAEDVQAVMVGGDWWLSGADIGGPVSTMLRRNGLRPTWDHWSYSSCLGNTYGMTLDLRTGITSAYKTSSELVPRLYDPILRSASFNAPGIAGRAHLFIQRVRAEPLVQRADGVVVDSIGHPATAEALAQQAISIVAVN